MINITYLPANDPFHAVFRMFVLFPVPETTSCSYESARILDFYVCFPVLISEFKCPRPLVKLHNALKRKYIPNTYQVTPKPAVLFNRMRAAQTAAVGSLQSYGFIEPKAFREGTIFRTKRELPDRVSATVEEHRKEHAELIMFLGELKTYSAYGPNGLRARSELEEYRYDDV
ncbi:ABC-three component system middle component 5 [Rhizobium sp. RAF36]|uniref:ABC-three component system middle component 5 n=1 Tax=Rhizobium sp. RAF36 TaxID=3233055 RepID=UPI003F9E578F